DQVSIVPAGKRSEHFVILRFITFDEAHQRSSGVFSRPHEMSGLTLAFMLPRQFALAKTRSDEDDGDRLKQVRADSRDYAVVADVG
ncbi:MAG: hypothetical protein ACT4NL_14230, partial [Pseudomarimonas sp.]